MTKIFENCCEVILASASPRRQMFLQEMGIVYKIMKSNVSEPLPNEGEDAATYAKRTALYKAAHVNEMLQDKPSKYIILAADTVVCINEKILGKPKDAHDALNMLKLLSGNEHTVISAVALLGNGLKEKQICFFESTKVLFNSWSEQVLAAYAKSGECDDKAGSYAIQGQGAFLVNSIHGSWSNVVGLPVSRLVHELLEHGVIKAV